MILQSARNVFTRFISITCDYLPGKDWRKKYVSIYDVSNVSADLVHVRFRNDREFRQKSLGGRG